MSDNSDESREALLKYVCALNKRDRARLEFLVSMKKAELVVLFVSPNYCTRDAIDWEHYLRANEN
jgi:hypothetical protein